MKFGRKIPCCLLTPMREPLLCFGSNFLMTRPIIAKLYRTEGEEQQAVVKEWLEMLEAMEEHALIGGKKFFGGDEINMVDIAFCMVAHWLGIIEHAAGLKVFEPHKFPRVSSWIQNFKSVPIIKDNLPNTDKIVAYLKRHKEMLLTSKSN
ncbi:hypothetical protein Gotur_007920 [Gossypium turneri]